MPRKARYRPIIAIMFAVPRCCLSTLKISSGYRNYALAVLTLTYVFNFLDRQLLAILLEPIKNEFGASDTAMGFLYGLAFSLFYATLAIPIAQIADRSSRRNILAIAAAVWSVMTMLCGLASGYWQLLALRVGVAVGEAGGAPPSQSMVNDLYPPAQRGRAMAIFASATFIGTLLALVGGAYMAENYGWRAAFLIVGAPGVLLAVLIWLTVPEPARGAWDAPHGPAETIQPGLVAILVQMWKIQALRYAMVGCAFAGMGGYSLGYWAPTFMIRIHSASLIQAGVMIGGIGATIGLLGSLFGGWLADRLARQNRGWLLHLAAVSLLLSLPTILLFLSFPETSRFTVGTYPMPTAFIFFGITSFIGGWWAAPTYVAVQEMVSPEQRTLTCAILLLMLNLVGFGVGPLLVGLFSDLLAPAAGIQSLRYALISIIGGSYLVAIVLYHQAGKAFNRQGNNA